MNRKERKLKRKSKETRLMGVLTLTSLLLIIWEMFIYRQTFINVFIPIFVLVAGGFCTFLIVRKSPLFYKGNPESSVLRSLYGTFTFGGILMFVFMALNHYVPIGDPKNISLKVLKADHFGDRYGEGDPYVIVRYNGMRKQLVFSHDVNIDDCVSVHLQIRTGLFGFKTIEKMELESLDLDYIRQVEEEKQYTKIKRKAEEYYSKGNTRKAIELYERAVQLKPSDETAAFRLKELRTLE